MFCKNLKKLWDKEELDLRWEKGQFTEANTLLVDDSPYKALCNPVCYSFYFFQNLFWVSSDILAGILIVNVIHVIFNLASISILPR